jgi:hypothetical protein
VFVAADAKRGRSVVAVLSAGLLFALGPARLQPDGGMAEGCRRTSTPSPVGRPAPPVWRGLTTVVREVQA